MQKILGLRTGRKQTGRTVPIRFRADVACFGTFGYELDLNHISEEFAEVKEQIKFMKQHRQLLQFGTFYRLVSPFETNMNAWMVVSEDKTEALVGVYTMRASVNGLDGRIRLAGLDKNKLYHIRSSAYYGDELMQAGLVLNEENTLDYTQAQDHSSCVICLTAE